MSIETIVKMVAELMEKKCALNDAVTKIAVGSDPERASALQHEVKAILGSTDSEDKDIIHVINKATKVTHIVLTGPGNGVDSNEYLARCGWRSGLVLHSFSMSETLCKKCHRTSHNENEPDASSSSDSSSSS
jgi:hypothetical protein